MRGWLVLSAVVACTAEPPARGPAPEVIIIPPGPARVARAPTPPLAAIEESAPPRVPGTPPPGWFVIHPSQSPPAMNVGAPPFDRQAAVLALDSVNLQKCARRRGPSGSADAFVGFNTSGEVSVVVLLGEFRTGDVGTCVAQTLGAVNVAPFLGKKAMVKTRFTVP